MAAALIDAKTRADRLKIAALYSVAFLVSTSGALWFCGEFF
jgi:hypothetical protein